MKREEILKQTETMKTVCLNGKWNVLVKPLREIRHYEKFLKDQDIRKADYKDTGLALCGILGKGESLKTFKENWIKRKLTVKN